MKRRTLLKGGLASSILSVAASAGLLTPRTVIAAWPSSAFTAKEYSEALKALHGSGNLSESSDITIKAPDIAENGAVVPITVSTSIKADTITLLVKDNPSPLACTYTLGDMTDGFISMRIKMGKTSDVIAIVKSGDKLHTAKKLVKVTIGGCGG